MLQNCNAVYLTANHRLTKTTGLALHRVLADGRLVEDGSPSDLLSDHQSVFSGLCAELGEQEQEQLHMEVKRMVQD